VVCSFPNFLNFVFGYETNIAGIGAQRKFILGEKDDDCVVFVAKKICHIGRHYKTVEIGNRRRKNDIKPQRK
jgi:hypothetical protein